MVRILIASVIALSLSLVAPAPAYAAANGGKVETSTGGAKGKIGTIVLAGVAGAVLGLSTLSFYGRPQDKLNHIAVGAAIGIISGAIFTTFKAATEPRDFYNMRDYNEANLFAMSGALKEERPLSAAAPQFSYSFSF